MKADDRSPRRLARDIALAVLLAAAGPAIVAPIHWAVAHAATAERAPLQNALAGGAYGDLEGAYAARGYRPIWINGGGLTAAGEKAVAQLNAAANDGLDPQNYDAATLAGLPQRLQRATPVEAADAELRISRAVAAYLADLHQPLRPAAMIFTDSAVAPETITRQAVIYDLATAPSAAERLARLQRMNPIYQDFRQALAAYRAQAPSHHAAGLDARERLLLANMERARALPTELGQRFILVDAAAEQLYLYEDGKVRDTMRVVVGKPATPTPMMAGLIRYAVYNPYWNVPPDLTRDHYAPQILQDRSSLAANRLEVVADWSDTGAVLDPSVVSWTAMAKGQGTQRLRQLPGPQNMMGKVKFMFPNNLGVYLHDTPNKAAFGEKVRVLSAGCVRLEDAARLARWLFRDSAVGPAGDAPEQQVVLPSPVPVYITYFTAVPNSGPNAVDARPDVYGRDAGLFAVLGSHDRAPPARPEPVRMAAS